MRHLYALVLLCCLAVPAGAQDYAAGADAFRRGEFAAALRVWRPLAEQGHAEAQFGLGKMHEYGRGVPQNDTAAIKWYRMAADRGVACAQYRLGVMYDNGWGLPHSDTEAVKWYRRAAKQDHAYAQFDLGLMYAFGTGVPQDPVRAYMWVDLAASQGNGHMLGHQSEIARSMTASQIESAERMARAWVETRRRN